MKKNQQSTVVLKEKVLALRQMLDRMHDLQNKLRGLMSRFQVVKDKREAEQALPF